MACPVGCSNQNNKFLVKCDACGCMFCGSGNCPGSTGEKLKLSGSGRSKGTKCKACGKGKMQKI